MDLPALVPITSAIDLLPVEIAEPKESTIPLLVQLELATTTPPDKLLDLPSYQPDKFIDAPEELAKPTELLAPI